MTLDAGVVLATAILAAIAAVMNTWAAIAAPTALRVTLAAKGGLAALYVAAYIWLLVNLDARAQWSRAMVGVSLVVWIIVWIAPAVVALRLTYHLRKGLR